LIQAPLGFAQWLCALDFTLSDPKEIAIVAPDRSGDIAALLEVVCSGYRPNQVVAVNTTPDRISAIPLLFERPAIDQRATAYVCVRFACQRPTTDPAILSDRLTSF
jgi:uncharacterized protein YyaL (SSP411 family)